MIFNFILTEPTNKIVGGYKVVYTYANYLVEQGHDVNIYYNCNLTNYIDVLKYPIRILLTYITPHFMKMNAKIKKSTIRSMSQKKIRSADYIIFTASPLIPNGMKFAEDKGRKYQLLQDHEIWAATNEELYDIYQLHIHRIAVSKWLKDLVEQYNKEECILLRNGIDLQKFKVINPINNRIPGSIIMLYHTNERKGIKRGLRILKKLKEEKPYISCIMFGSPRKNKEIPEWVEYHKNVNEDDLCELYNNAAIFFCPSYYEGFGLPGMESMACGCAVVSSDTLGVREYAKDGYNALLSDANDDSKLYINLKALIEDNEKRIKLAFNALESIDELSIERSKEKFLKIFEKKSKEG